MRHPSVPARFAVCVRNGAHPASLEVRKLYEVLPDAEAEALGHLRVVDESGEDYVYPAEYFREIEVPETVADALRST